MISITDGQIYLDTARFERDQRPASDIGRSVSRIGALYLVSARFDGLGCFTPMCTRLLPIAPMRSAALVRPSPYVTSDHLAAVAVREFLYIALYEVLLDALASEYGMRLTATEAALQWIDTTAAHTARQLTASRSETATQEVLDIVAGAKARL